MKDLLDVLVSILVVVDSLFKVSVKILFGTGLCLFQSLLWWIRFSKAPPEIMPPIAIFVSILVVVDSLFKVIHYNDLHEWAKGFNPCCGGFAFQSIYSNSGGGLWRGFNPCCGGFAFQSAFAVDKATGASEFQSLLWWIRFSKLSAPSA